MDKQVFLARLREGLSGLPMDEVEERLSFYSEMIDDRMEDGLSEEAAVAEIGPTETVVTQIVAEIPLPRIMKERMKPERRLRGWEIMLLILGFPVWFPLLAAALVLLLSAHIVIWSVVLALWAVELSLIVGALGGAAAGVLLLGRGSAAQGGLLLCAGMVLAGLAVFLFLGCRAASCGAAKLTRRIAVGVKSRFLRKERA